MLGEQPDTRDARIALELFFAIAGKLEASDADQAGLLGVDIATVRGYRVEKYLPEDRDALERISYVVSIWLALTSIFSSESDATRGLHSPNDSFSGASPFQQMLTATIEGLVDVRSEVEALFIS